METTALPTNQKEISQVTSLLKQKGEIFSKVEYYKAILKATDLLIRGIEEKIDFPSYEIKIKVLGMTFNVIRRTTDYERAKLLMEKIELENQMFYQKRYYENWLQRRNEYEVYFDKLTAECNAKFEGVYQEALRVAKTNLRLANAIKKYKDDGNQELKNEFYLYISQEIKNRNDAR